MGTQSTLPHKQPLEVVKLGPVANGAHSAKQWKVERSQGGLQGKPLLVQVVPGRIVNAQAALQVWTFMSCCGALRLSHRAPNWQNEMLEGCSA